MFTSCLDEKILSSYLDEKISKSDRGKIESHISKCNTCLDILLVAYEARTASKKCPEMLKQKIRNCLGLKEKKKRAELKWLFCAVVLFVLSFVARRYFLQFLAASVVMGFKWVMESEGAKRAVMIFRGISKKETSYPQDRLSQKDSFQKFR